MPDDRSDNRPMIALVARPYSVHVFRWLKLFDLAGIRVSIDTADPPNPLDTKTAPVHYLAPNVLQRVPGLAYLWAGIVARWRHRNTPLLHAHCTSGSGVIAWMSGRPYIVTTYGSEIFGAAERGRLYRWMIQRVLSGAELVTATTPKMAAMLEQEFGVPPERIREFSLSYDVDLFRPPLAGEQLSLRRRAGLPNNETLWVVNRRTLPLYRTREVVTGFLRFCETHPSGSLVLLSGYDDAAYRVEIQQLMDRSAWGTRVRFIEGVLSSAEVADWLKMADFAISVPQTDQLSTSILESMACEAVPCLSRLEAYRPLRECEAIQYAEECTAAGFEQMFVATSALSTEECGESGRRCAEFVSARFSEQSCMEHVRSLYGLMTQVHFASDVSRPGTHVDASRDAA